MWLNGKVSLTAWQNLDPVHYAVNAQMYLAKPSSHLLSNFVTSLVYMSKHIAASLSWVKCITPSRTILPEEGEKWSPSLQRVKYCNSEGSGEKSFTDAAAPEGLTLLQAIYYLSCYDTCSHKWEQEHCCVWATLPQSSSCPWSAATWVSLTASIRHLCSRKKLLKGPELCFGLGFSTSIFESFFINENTGKFCAGS